MWQVQVSNLSVQFADMFSRERPRRENVLFAKPARLTSSHFTQTISKQSSTNWSSVCHLGDTGASLLARESLVR